MNLREKAITRTLRARRKGRSSAKDAVRGATGNSEAAARSRATVGTSGSDQINGEDQTGGGRINRHAQLPRPYRRSRFDSCPIRGRLRV
jgi:hypothetical protein